MNWLIYAFSGPILWALSTHIDKYLLNKYFKNGSATVLMVFTSIFGAILLPFIWFHQPDVFQIPLKNIFVILFSGILYMGAMLFYLQALQSEEASTVAPFYQATPIFGFIMGYFILGEVLSKMQVFGGLLIIAGTLLLSFNFALKKHVLKFRLIALMLACTFSLAISSVIFKLFAIQDEFWSTTFWTYAGEVIFGLGILSTSTHRKQFFKLLKKNTASVLGVNSFNEIIALVGGIGVRYASILAPLSLVQAISNTSVLFVFIIGILITVFIPSLGKEDLSKANLVRKGIAAVLVVLGVIIINR